MGLRQIAGFLAIYPRVEKCGIFGVWSQSKETPTTEFEVCTLGTLFDEIKSSKYLQTAIILGSRPFNQ